jgi:hypothetical protein
MAVAIEFINLIIPIANIEKHYLGGFAQYRKDVRHRSVIWSDNYIVRDGAMNSMDIGSLVREWERRGLQPTEIVDNVEKWKDLCVVEVFGGKTLPCDWLVENEDGTVSHIDENSKTDSVIDGIAPDHITELAENEIFVFGSNIHGRHAGGAARMARIKWGAIQGQGEGLQGQTYAIPTMFKTVEEIQPYVHRFIAFAAANPDKCFLVTKIGCGIAGFEVEEIANLFVDVIDKNIKNVFLPKDFFDHLTYNVNTL